MTKWDRRLFQYLDKDNSGVIERTEFVEGVRRGGLVKDGKRVVRDDRLLRFFDAIDTDRSGTIEVEEFVEFIGEYKKRDPEVFSELFLHRNP